MVRRISQDRLIGLFSAGAVLPNPPILDFFSGGWLFVNVWRRVGPVGRSLNLNATLIGRLVIGPAIMIGTFLASEASLLAAGSRTHWSIWT